MNKLKIVTDLARQAGYNEGVKAQYKRLAMSVLRSIAKSLQLPKSSYNLRYNAGGIAVAGEATLHHDHFYLQIWESGIMFRRCDGQRDYGSAKMGGDYRNQWAQLGPYSIGNLMTTNELIVALEGIMRRATN